MQRKYLFSLMKTKQEGQGLTSLSSSTFFQSQSQPSMAAFHFFQNTPRDRYMECGFMSEYTLSRRHLCMHFPRECLVPPWTRNSSKIALVNHPIHSAHTDAWNLMKACLQLGLLARVCRQENKIYIDIPSNPHSANTTVHPPWYTLLY